MQFGMMQLSRVALISALVLGACAREEQNPVSRVAALLTNLASKIESELDTETDLYESYVCWAKNVMSTKTASNEQAQSRVDSLKTYLADLDAGRIELSTERSDLEKEVAQLSSDIETADALRKKENEDYEAATKEMGQATKAMESAIKVLEEATKDSKASLVSLRARISQTELNGESEGFGARVEEAQELQQAVNVASKWLKAGDALFLQRLLSGEVPQKDWKKLNRKASFKMAYKMRSGKIQETVKSLLQQIKDQQADADAKEKKSKDTYDTLSGAKQNQLDAAADALKKEEVENGAKSVSSADANAEVDALETQITDDKKYISETETALEDKKKEFTTRKGLRVGEIAAINKAKAVIHSDDARDLFKRSISFVQVASVSGTSVAAAQAMGALRAASKASGDLRLEAMADRLDAGARFDKVLKSIDEMIAELEQDGKDDDANKKECEDEREANTKEAAGYARDIDELSDDISKLEAEIKEIVKEIEEKEQKVKDTEKEVKDAKALRKKENAEWKQTDADDSAAIKLLENCADVLKTFYKENFSLVQNKNVAKVVAPGDAGEAPVPPPKTWEGDYGGSQKEQTGIVGILDLIKTDCEKDQTSAKESEDTAQKDHDKFVKESEDSINKLNEAINDLDESKGKKEKSITDKEETSATKKGSLESVIKKMEDAKPGCDFLLVNFKTRSDNRKLESDGLKKAKEILEEKNKL